MSDPLINILSQYCHMSQKNEFKYFDNNNN